jgi:hypothetical protein
VHQVDVGRVAGVEGRLVVRADGVARIVLHTVGRQEHLVAGARLQRLLGVEVDDAQLHAVGARQRVAAHRAHDEGVGIHALGPDVVRHAQANARGQRLLLRAVGRRDLLHFGLGGVGVHRMHDEAAAGAVVVAHEDEVAEHRDLAVVRVREVRIVLAQDAAAAHLHVVERIAHVDLVDARLRALDHVVVLRGAVELLVDDEPVVLGHEARAVAQVVAVHLGAAVARGGVQVPAVEAGRVVERRGAHDGIEHLGVERIGDVQARETAVAFHRGQHHVVAHREDRADAEAAEFAGGHRVGLAGAAVRDHGVRRVPRIDDEDAPACRGHVQVGRLPPELPGHVLVVAAVDAGQCQLLHLLDVVDVGEVPELDAVDAGQHHVRLAADLGGAEGVRFAELLGAGLGFVDLLDQLDLARVRHVVQQKAARAEAAVRREGGQEVAVDHDARVHAVVLAARVGGGHLARFVGAAVRRVERVRGAGDHRHRLEQLRRGVGEVAQARPLQRERVGDGGGDRCRHVAQGRHRTDPGDCRVRQQCDERHHQCHHVVPDLHRCLQVVRRSQGDPLTRFFSGSTCKVRAQDAPRQATGDRLP